MSKKNMPIGVFDSGIGGLTVLEKLIELFPHENFVYVADQGHCPYGTKTAEQVGERVAKVTKFLTEEHNAKAVVIACNTASLRIDYAKKVTSVPVISVIEPTCQKAVSLTKNGKIIVLATIATINSGTYQRLIEQQGKTPVPLACSEFVDFVEHHDLTDPLGQQIVTEKLNQIKDCGADTLIHGCTHFSLLQPQMENVLGKINYVACGLPTGNCLAEILAQNNLLSTSTESGSVQIFTTGSVDNALATMKWFTAPHSPVVHTDID